LLLPTAKVGLTTRLAKLRGHQKLNEGKRKRNSIKQYNKSLKRETEKLEKGINVCV
jgi:hypothetical protein